MVADHSYLIVQIGFLLDALERIKQNGFNPDDVSIIKKVINYFNSDLKNHNQLEEVNLFTKSKSVKKISILANRLKAEHRIMWDKIEILKEVLEQYELDHTDLNFSNLYKTSTSLIDLIRNHILKEDNELFPLLEKTLKKSDLDSLNKLI